MLALDSGFTINSLERECKVNIQGLKPEDNGSDQIRVAVFESIFELLNFVFFSFSCCPASFSSNNKNK